MTSENKTILLRNIDNLYADGGTNIYEGLQKGLSLITNDFSNVRKNNFNDIIK